MANFLNNTALSLNLLVLLRDRLQFYETPSPSPAQIPSNVTEADLSRVQQVPCELLPIDLPVANTGLRLAPATSSNGKYMALTAPSMRMMIIDVATRTVVSQIANDDALHLQFSPLGNFIITWSQPSTVTGSNEGNLRIWNTLSGEMISSYAQKVFRAESIQWTADEAVVVKQITNEVQIYSGNASISHSSGMLARIQVKGFTQFSIAKVPSREGLLPVAFFSPESGGKAAKVVIYHYNFATNEVSGPIGNGCSIIGASEASLTWNALGTALLIYSQSNVDTSGASYYGSTSLYYINAQGENGRKVQTGEGLVHEAKWSPEGDRFIVCAGTMPCPVVLYDVTAEPVFNFGAAHRNTISWSPHGRFVCIAGFGNLAGEMDFYDMSKLKKIGSNLAHCATTFGWSPDSRYFHTASLAPRMNVDNHLSIFRYNGDGPLLRMDFDRAYEVAWIPTPKELYPDRAPSPGRNKLSLLEKEVKEKAAAAAKKDTKPAPYRPPHSTGSLSQMMHRPAAASAPQGKIGKQAAAPAKPVANNAPVPAAKFVPSAKNQRIPGMAPAAAAAKAPQQQQQQQQQQAKAAPAQQPQAKAAPAVSNNKAVVVPVANTTTVAVPIVESAESKEKRAKAISKKLKQIDDIKAKIAAGQSVEPEQMEKLKSEATLRAELSSLA